jgi:hypothetical protein
VHKNLQTTLLCAALALSAAPSPALASDDRRPRRSDGNPQQQQQQQSNTQRTRQSNTQRTITNTSTGATTTTLSAGSVSNANSNNYIAYPDWINVAPSQSAVSIDSVTCQGPTLTATASTLTTDTFSNQYGIQGAFGFSVPIGGQADCHAVQTAIRKRAAVENSLRIALACKQLETSGIQLDLTKFPDLAICSPQ